MSEEVGSEMRLYKPDEVAEILRCSKGVLAKWRSEGVGPAYVKLGRSVYYRKSAVVEYLESNTVEVSR